MNSKGIFDTDFKVVWQGQFVSQLGTSAHLIGFAFYLKSATQSAGIVGTVSFITGLLALAALPFAGVICDNFPRRSIVLTCDLLCAALICILALGFLISDSERVRISLLCGVAPLLSICSAFFKPAFGAMLPDIVGREHLPKANSLYKGGARVGELLGSVSGRLVYRLLGPTLLFTLNGCSYLFAYRMLRRTTFQRTNPLIHGSERVQFYLSLWGISLLRLFPLNGQPVPATSLRPLCSCARVSSALRWLTN